MPLEARLVPINRPSRRSGRGRQQGGNLLSILTAANQIAKAVKPATILGNVLDATGASKGRVGKVIRDLASVGQQLGYGNKRGRGRRRK